MVGPLRYFSFQTVFHDWSNKGRGMCYPDHINDPLLLMGNVVHVAAERFLYRYLSGPLPYV